MPPRLLYLMNEALFFTTHRMPVAAAARAAGFEVHVAAPFEADPVRVIEANGFTYHPIPLDRSGTSIAGEVRLLAAFWRLIGEVRPLLTHHVAMKPVAYGGLVARLRGVPAVVHAVTGLGYLFIRDDRAARLQRSVVKELFHLALGHVNARVIFQNLDDRALFVTAGLVDAARTTLIRGTGVDLRRFAVRPEPAGPVTVMFPARLIGDKGLGEFMAAARLLRAAGSAARFVLVGRTDPVNPTAVDDATVRRWEAEGLVEWWGYRDDMATTLAAAHVVCMPSYREGLPRVLIEAAACGRPIVTTDVPGCREIVRDGENGLLVPARDGAATAAALARLIDDAALRHRLGAGGRAMAEAEYAVEGFVARTLDVYREALAGVTPRPAVLP